MFKHCSLLLSLSLFPSLAVAQVMLAVSPADRTGLEGSSFTHFPLGRADARMQTLHRDVPAGTVISGHAYRRDAITVRGLVDAFTCDMEVRLSVSPNLPTQASTTFATNAGSNVVTVLPRTLVAFPATNRPALDPAATFELQVPYQVPFTMPAGGGTLCVDVIVYGNTSAAGNNQNLSVYLDAHEHFNDGRSEAAGFRTFSGCARPGSTTLCTATMSLWHFANGPRLDVSIRDGIADDGTGVALPFVMLGTSVLGSPWPLQPGCTMWSSNEIWFPLPGTMNLQGNYDGALATLPPLPPGYRLWCQAGTVHWSTVAMTFSDAVTMVTPAPGTLPVPTARIVNSTNHLATTGTVSLAVPVMAFF